MVSKFIAKAETRKAIPKLVADIDGVIADVELLVERYPTEYREHLISLLEPLSAAKLGLTIVSAQLSNDWKGSLHAQYRDKG